MDPILTSWLEASVAEAQRLADASDRLDFEPIDPQRYVAHFHCRGLVREPSGEIVEAGEFAVGIAISDDYLRCVDAMRLLTWLAPHNLWHPNQRGSTCCIGAVSPGTPFVDLLHRIYMVITYQEVMPDERDALNRAACSWARANLQRFPVDDRPLKRRAASPARFEEAC